MIDMLVRLYELPDSGELYRKLEGEGVTLRRPHGYERHILADWVGRQFSPKWVSETKVAFARQPVSAFIATREKEILGFACYDTTMKGYFGPTGVADSARGIGLGKALLFKALEALRDDGYAYGVIGGVGPREFYEKACGAFEIPGSDPGIFGDLLPDP
jgi:GNAT superfamily N-acetyltransferase